jgi:hypothetical protein
VQQHRGAARALRRPEHKEPAELGAAVGGPVQRRGEDLALRAREGQPLGLQDAHRDHQRCAVRGGRARARRGAAELGGHPAELRGPPGSAEPHLAGRSYARSP